MQSDRYEWRFVWGSTLLLAAPCGALLVWLLFSSTQDLNTVWGVAGIIIVLAAFVGRWLARYLYRRYVRAMPRLAEDFALLMAGESDRALAAESGPPQLRALAAALKSQAQIAATKLRDIEGQIAEARASSERDRDQLAALIADLPQGVLLLSADASVLLYNNLARQLLVGGRGEAEGGAYLGLGRSLDGLIDASLIQHVREATFAALQAGRWPQGMVLSSSTLTGRLLRVRVTPIFDETDRPTPDAATLRGFVVLIEDLTRAAEQSAQRERITQEMVDAQQSGLYKLRLQAERLRTGLAQTNSVDCAALQAVLTELHEEAMALSAKLSATTRQHAELWRANWMLADMRGMDLLLAAQSRISARLGLPIQVQPAGPAEAVLLRVDSFALVQVLGFLAQRVCESCDPAQLFLALEGLDEKEAQIVLQWPGSALSSESAAGWELEAMNQGGEATSQSVREVLAWHGAELSFGRDRARALSHFKISLAQASATPEHSVVQRRSRNDFYDFDLLRADAQGLNFSDADALDALPLSALSYTAFDTETTGLDPRGGDEIIQIGALRILRGRLLRDEKFLQLVDPKRDIPAESLRIHGISREATRGQPTILEVLPRFAAFARDTVLLGHNIAFDMRFFKMKERATGQRFAQPMLDTLLLSAVLHPQQDSHRLENIAERFGVAVVDRHDALGDARVAAEIFLRMIPLLAAQGITTLGQARAASEKTYYARIQY